MWVEKFVGRITLKSLDFIGSICFDVVVANATPLSERNTKAQVQLDFAPAKVGGSEKSKLKRELVPTLDENKTMQNSNVVVAASTAVVNTQENLHIRVAFPIDKECIRKFVLKDNGKDIVIYHLYPLLSDWQGKSLPDEVNPRSHDEQALKSGVARRIETTLIESPEDFYLANRGATILAQDLKFTPPKNDHDKGFVELFVTDESLHGIADGATTDAVLGKVQRDIQTGAAQRESGDSVAADSLNRGRIHLEIILGLVSQERINAMVEGRNTSRQVTPWSMSDFKGAFDWISDILEVPSSPFRGKVGYEENAGKQITVLDILSLLTLFHPAYDEKRKAPTVAYSSKGRMDARLNDPKLLPGYKALAPLMQDILNLHDTIYAGFENAYKEARDGKAKLGKRQGIEQKLHNLPLTGIEVNYVIPSGLIFPLLASLRGLIGYDKTGNAYWKSDAVRFFEKYGGELVATLIEQLEMLGGNPQTAGKKKPVYTALHDRARLLLSDEMNS